MATSPWGMRTASRAAAAAGDRSERAFEFVTIAEDAVSAPSESSEKEA